MNKMESKPKPTAAPGLDMSDLLMRVIKYALEGLAVAIAVLLLIALGTALTVRLDPLADTVPVYAADK